MDASDAWLVRYPLFREALLHGAMPLRALPSQARAVVAKRVFTGDGAREIAGSAGRHVVGDVRVAFVELPMTLVEEAVRQHREPDGRAPGQGEEHADLDAAIGETRLHYPRVARPPCLLMPGQGVFLDSWMRYFVYRTRGDITVPLPAVDWFTLYERVSRMLEGEPVAAQSWQASAAGLVSRERGLIE
jgi:hypothetical protein